MARGRNDVRKKPETSSSVSEGRVWEAPSQKEKRDFIVVIFCRDMALRGPCTRAGHRPSSVHFVPIISGRDICKI